MAVLRLGVLLFIFWCSPLEHVLGQGTITSPDRRHGSAQLQQLLLDRPDMKGVLPPGTAVNTWIESAFANTAGRRVYWDNRVPVSGRTGEHTLPTDGYPCSVRITNESKVSPLDKFSILIFELHNAKRASERHELRTLALAGGLSEQDFAERFVTTEFYAVLETQAFLKAHLFDRMTTQTDYFTLSYLNAGDDLNAFLQHLRSEPGENTVLEHYKKWYRSAFGNRSGN